MTLCRPDEDALLCLFTNAGRGSPPRLARGEFGMAVTEEACGEIMLIGSRYQSSYRVVAMHMCVVNDANVAEE